MSTLLASAVLETRVAALRNGFVPLPIPAGQKGPMLKGWQRVAPDAAMLRQWDTERTGDTNTGILCGTVLGVDLDVLDPAVSADLEFRATLALGEGALRRTGRAPKLMLLFRAAGPGFTKLATRPFTLEGQKAQVEVLATGQQFVAFGTHPDTKRPYVWADDRSPGNTPLVNLPTVTLAQLQAFVAMADQVLEQAGGVPQGSTVTVAAGSADRSPPPSEEALAELIEAAPNTLHDRAGWIGFLHGVHGAMRDLATAGLLTEDGEARVEAAVLEWNDQYPQDEAEDGRWEEIKSQAPKGGWRTLLRYGADMGLDTSKWALEAAQADFSPLPVDPDGEAAKAPPMLDRGAPLQSARELLRRSYTTEDGQQTLYRSNGAFYCWTGTHYVEAGDADLAAQAYTFLDRAFHVSTDGGDKASQVAFKPTAARVRDVLDALRAAAHLPGTVRMPIWLGGTEGRPEATEVLPCANGLLHLPTRRLWPHSPQFFGLNALPYAYQPDAADPAHWLAFLRSIWPDDADAIGTLQEVFGLLLTTDLRHHKIVLMVGPKRSGKGTIARVLTELLGRENVANPTLASLGQNFGIAPLIGKPLALIADARLGGRADTHAVTERLLSISGEDGQTLDRKHREAWSGTLPTRFLIMSNELPRFVDASGALASRFVIMQMRNSFLGREDQGLTARLLGELPGILNWALAGLDRLNTRGHFIQPASASEAVAELEDLASPIGAFLRERCLVGPDHSVECQSLFRVWQGWCEVEGHPPGSSVMFGRSLRAALPDLGRRQSREGAGREWRYFGLGFLPEISEFPF